MEIFLGPEEVYDELVENSEENWLLGLVGFAIVEEQRIEWMKHQTEYNGGKPSADEINNWYKQQAKGVLLRAKDTAEARLKDYSDEIVGLVLDEQIKEIEESVIISEIRETKKFWPQFGVNLAGGFTSAILFGLLLLIAAFFVINDTSPTEIGTELRNKIEENGHGKERSHE